MASVRDNVLALRAELAGHPDVCVVAVSKYATVEQMIDAYEAGIRDFGENKIQDVERKAPLLPEAMVRDIRWHFVGHLQKNKVRKTLHRFWLIQSVDSLELAQKLSLANTGAGSNQRILLQVNLTREPQKSGFLEEELLADISAVLDLPGLDVVGLMTIGPHTADGEESRRCFGHLSMLRGSLVQATGHPFPHLSMGMSQDFHHAIECGATIIRIGNRLFGA